jgi:hypothetical protein
MLSNYRREGFALSTPVPETSIAPRDVTTFHRVIARTTANLDRIADQDISQRRVGLAQARNVGRNAGVAALSLPRQNPGE